MKRSVIIVIIALLSNLPGISQVSEMNWELDYQIYLTMANDSNYMYDVRNLFHITDLKNPDFTSEFVFYPVNPGESYGMNVRENKNNVGGKLTLWSALHQTLGGGWIHFTNCIAYALETEALDLTEPIMKRPETSWKPDPVTETWQRTRKWEYYIPVSQKAALKEYKIRVKNDQLGDLQSLPKDFIDNFHSASDSKYAQMKKDGELKKTAQIDLVKVLLGANYLGEPQINYISNAVLNAIQNYSSGKLPSVLIFDDFDAAAAMTLDSDGYQVESIVFRSSAELSENEVAARQKEITEIIETINDYNRESFRKRLSSYYGN